MPATKLGLYELLAPQFLVGFTFPDYIDQYLAFMGVDELHTASDESGVVYTGQVSFDGPAGASPVRQHRDPSGAVFGWEDVTLGFRLTIPRDGTAVIHTAVTNTVVPLTDLDTLFNRFGAVEQTATIATEYPGVRFRLKLLVSALTFHLGKEWKPGEVGPDHRIVPSTDPAETDKDMRFVLPKMVLQYEQGDDPSRPPEFNLNSWGSAGFDAPHDLAEGELVRMVPPIAIHESGRFGFGVDEVLLDLSPDHTPPEILEFLATDESFKGLLIKALRFYYTDKNKDFGINIAVKDALISFAGQVSLELSVDLLTNTPLSTFNVEVHFFNGSTDITYNQGNPPDPSHPLVLTNGRATVPNTAVVQVHITGGFQAYTISVKLDGSELWNSTRNDARLSPGAPGTLLSPGDHTLVVTVDDSATTVNHYSHTIAQSVTPAQVATPSSSQDGSSLDRPPETSTRQATTLLINPADEPLPAGYALRFTPSTTGKSETLVVEGGTTLHIRISDGATTLVDSTLTGSRSVSIDVPHGSSYDVVVDYMAVASLITETFKLFFDLDKPYAGESDQSPRWPAVLNLYSSDNPAHTDTRFGSSTAPSGGSGSSGAAALRDWINTRLAAPKSVTVDAFASFELNRLAAHDHDLSDRRRQVALAIIGSLANVTGGSAHGHSGATGTANPCDRVVKITGTISPATPAKTVRATLTRSPRPAPTPPSSTLTVRPTPTPPPPPDRRPAVTKRLSFPVRLECNIPVMIEFSGELDFETEMEQLLRTASGTSSTDGNLGLTQTPNASATAVTNPQDVTASSGLFTLNTTTGGGSDLTGTLGLDTATGTTGAFPDEDRRLLALGPATTGRLVQSFHPLALPTGITLTRDILSLRVVQLKPFLLGSPNTAFNGALVELRPAVRINEPLNLLADGNDVLASASAALSGTPTEGLAVAQAINGSFSVPSASGSAAHWPAFPPLGGVTAAPAGPLSINLRIGFTPAAHYFDDGNPATPNIDVVLTINGLPARAAVRVYARKFVEDAKEARGDGAGGVVPDSGTLILLLKNPFSFPAILVTPPALPTLRFDLIIVKRNGETRMYGNIEIPVAAATTSSSAVSGSDPFGTAARRGVSNAGVLGLGTHSLPSTTGLTPGEATLTILQALTGETTPRDASRLPTMARRDLLVAGLSGSNWIGVLAGGRLEPEIHSAAARLGSPGGQGGRETQVVGVSTQNARLAYDIARIAFRRTTNIVTRLNALSGSAWNEPAQPASLAVDSPPNASQGTIAGAALQTIAPMCETPELGLLKSLVEAKLSSIPASFDALVDWLVGQVNTLAASSAITSSTFLSGIVNNIKTQIITALNNLKENSTLNESTKERLFNELHHELMAACFGRRDAQWALAGAISNARRFIYIESPAFASTQKDYGAGSVPAYAINLIEQIRTRLNQASGLQVMICTPKFPDFPAGYEAFSAQEAADRQARILGLPAERVVAFHPVGFPGRPSRLESTVVIVDDVWAIVGSSTFRRRGLTFDGGSDLVFTDFDLVKGRSVAIAAFRRRLLADRLGVSAFTTNSFGSMPDPTFIRLADGVEAFYAVREWLVAGGLGKIERLWNGVIPGVPAVSPVSLELANPDGIEFDLLGTLALSALTGLNSA